MARDVNATNDVANTGNGPTDCETHSLQIFSVPNDLNLQIRDVDNNNDLQAFIDVGLSFDTGVQPFSCSALIDTIGAGVDVSPAADELGPGISILTAVCDDIAGS